MNQCIFIGRLAADPESRTTQSGIANATFRLAVQRRFKDANGERQADFIQCVAWRQTAEYVTKYLHKGNTVGVIGSLQNRSYDAQDGSKRFVTEIVVDNVEFLASAQGKQESAEPPTEQHAQGGFTEVDDESELPF